jgi:hypothetical protein
MVREKYMPTDLQKMKGVPPMECHYFKTQWILGFLYKEHLRINFRIYYKIAGKLD